MTSEALFRAILAMDSYNRGYGSDVALTGQQIGLATVSIDSEQIFRSAGQPSSELSPAGQAGFYAIAYNWNGHFLSRDRLRGRACYPRHTNDFRAI